jgi:hypothetical protein
MHSKLRNAISSNGSEFKTIDNSNRIVEPDVLGAQVAVTVDDAAGARGKRLAMMGEKPLLDTSPRLTSPDGRALSSGISIR